MRLTLINQFYPPDIAPTGALLESLAEHRADRGDEVTVVTSRGGYVKASTNRSKTNKRNPCVDRLWTPQFGKATIVKRCLDYAAFYLLAAWRMLRLPRQDVIVAMTTPPYIAWTALLHKLLHPRTRVILWSSDCYPEVAERAGVIRPGGMLSRLMRAVNRAMFRSLDHVVCLDTAMRSLLQSHYAHERALLPATVIPNWEPAAFYPPEIGPRRPSERADRGLGERFVVLYSGNMGRGHRFETVIDAAEALRNEPVTFLFVGAGAQRRAIESAKRQRNLENVLVDDYVPKQRLRALLATADCALITMRDEMLGLISPSKLHANLAMGIPIIYVGPEKSNVDEAIRQFDCGVSLRHGDTAGLVDFIRAAMKDPRYLADLGARARAAFDRAYCDRCTLPMFDAVIDRTPLPDRTVREIPPQRKAA
ncbi:MAG TPA: glycosyltransferase family 4 protein [Thermoguttaceae bacterium]|nr:glycosyltransferase family 4 protein [Thermoguttaceae bacterium]